jgi:predicted lipid-binding transport protein (Tim44 family)
MLWTCYVWVSLLAADAAAQETPGIVADLQAMVGKLVAMLVGAIIVGNLLLIALKRGVKANTDELEDLGKPISERGSSVGASGTARMLALRPRRDVDLIQLIAVLPDFRVASFRKTARMLFEAVQHARPSRDASTLGGRLTEGALEVVFLGLPGLREVRRIEFCSTRLMKTAANETGIIVKVRFEVWMQELREEGWADWWSIEDWTFTRRDPAQKDWNVLHIDRDDRGLLAKPRTRHVDLEDMDLHLAADPELDKQLEAFQTLNPSHDWDMFKKGARIAFERVQGGLSRQAPEALASLITPFCLEELRTYVRRHHRFAVAAMHLDPKVTRVDPARVTRDANTDRVTVRITGAIADRVEDGEGNEVGEPRHAPRPFSVYWTFVRETGKPWVVDVMDEDDTWVV